MFRRWRSRHGEDAEGLAEQGRPAGERPRATRTPRPDPRLQCVCRAWSASGVVPPVVDPPFSCASPVPSPKCSPSTVGPLSSPVSPMMAQATCSPHPVAAGSGGSTGGRYSGGARYSDSGGSGGWQQWLGFSSGAWCSQTSLVLRCAYHPGFPRPCAAARRASQKVEARLGPSRAKRAPARGQQPDRRIGGSVEVAWRSGGGDPRRLPLGRPWVAGPG